MSKRDYYEVLGVSQGVSDAELKKSYRRLAMKHHPDRNPDDEHAAARFKEVQEAYSVLADSRKRSAYDQFGHAGVDPSMGGGGGPGGFNFQDVSDVFGDIFGDIFGGARGGRGQQQAQRGADLGYEMVITLEEAVFGATKEIKVPTNISCQSCDGSGARKGSSPVNCETCRGSGQVQMQHGFIAIQQTCPKCRGQGKVIKDPCRACHGQGRVRHTKNLNVKIPAGVDDGDRIRLSGEGEAGMHGAPAGDLYVQMQVKKHTVFDRHGNDLYTGVPISFITAALGGEILVPTMQGEVKLTIPAETQTGKAFRLRGKGVKALRSGQVGDLLCKVIIETPVSLTDDQKQHLKDFQEMLNSSSKKHSPKEKSWFHNVKDFFKT